jgi:Na+-driven multidrug efflux pump
MAHFRPELRGILEILRLASTASLQILVETASWIGLVRIVSTFGSIALAGYTIAMRIAVFALLPAWGNANAAATLVGQNLGAKQPERAQATVYTIARYNVIYLASVGVLFFVFAPQLLAFFDDAPAVQAEGSASLRIVSVGLAVFAYGMVAVQAFNGAGDTVTPLLVNLFSFWAFKLPLAFLLSRVVGTRGVYAAVTAAYSIQALVATVLFRRGRWRRTKA